MILERLPGSPCAPERLRQAAAAADDDDQNEDFEFGGGGVSSVKSVMLLVEHVLREDRRGSLALA